ncbi:cytochrome b [Thiocapsa bogorovii]|uniref:cytochrome b n=1 Tax=Thiocapsa bogorovii TaxID=521689 RepID=UPI001E591552|nr:cytochrome b [Thiocapsa bogorovii]UHD18361.1 cytochrome b [Thiocapsa bogorovii]
METLRYNYVQRILHWLIVLLVLGLLAAGALLGNLGFDGLKDLMGLEMTNQLYGYHKTFGIIVLALMVLRLAFKRLFRSPAYQPPLSGLERGASLTVHSLFYVALILMPVFGWLGTAAGGFPVQFFNLTLPGLIPENKALSETLFQLHGIVGWVILGLILIHVSAAIYHWRIKRDGVMKRMSLF